jgi:2-iminobutanoate/2-iminopropanoate deaminase
MLRHALNAVWHDSAFSHGAGDMPTIEKFCAAGVFDPPTYSQGIKVSQGQTILFLSGQVAYTPDGGVACRGDFKGQARGAYEAIKALVESQGATMGNIVKITTFVTDIRYRLDLAPLREEFFGKKGPASTLVEISALAHPDWMIEVEAIAVV